MRLFRLFSFYKLWISDYIWK